MELIAINADQIGSEQTETINARELWRFLESKQEFSTWVKSRIEQYQFVENLDFIVIDKFINNPQNGVNRGGRTQIDYHITLDMAKELAMVERNEKGRQARQYFIECERRVKSNTTDLETALSDPNRLRGLLLTYTEKVATLEVALKEAEPKVKFHDDVAVAVNCQSLQDAAKVLNTGVVRLFEFLRGRKLLMRNNKPYQRYIEKGYFRVLEEQFYDISGHSRIRARTFITGKGIQYVHERLPAARL